MQIGDMVISKAGHDKDKVFVITAIVNGDFVLMADGSSRPTENPKLKRKRHLRVVAQSGITDPTNAALRKRIKQFNSERRKYAEK